MDLIGRNTPLSAHSLYSGLSMELKLFINHYETPCMLLKHIKMCQYISTRLIGVRSQPTQFYVVLLVIVVADLAVSCCKINKSSVLEASVEFVLRNG